MVCLLSIDDGVFELKSIGGDTHLVGEDFDSVLVDHFVKDLKRKNINKSDLAMKRLHTQCARATKTLSVAARVNIEINLVLSITRARFEAYNCLQPASKVLQDPKMI